MTKYQRRKVMRLLKAIHDYFAEYTDGRGFFDDIQYITDVIKLEEPTLRLHSVVRQEWAASERDWGRRPDGYSLHLNDEDCKQFRNDHTRNYVGAVPDVYDFPSGNPTVVDVDKETYEKIRKSKNGIRLS